MSVVRLHLLAALGFCLLAVLLTWPLPLHLGTQFPGNPGGDTGVYVWNLWIFRHEVLAGRLPFYTSSILSATNTPVNLSLHNYTTFANLLALPLLSLLDIVTTFNLIYLFNIALTGYAMFALSHDITERPAESWLSGMLFTGSPFLIARGTAHFSLVAAAPLPLFALFMRRTTAHHRMTDAALAGATVAWASFCDAYYGVYCLLIATIMLLMHAFRVRRVSGLAAPSRLAFVRMLDVLLLVVGGFIVGMLIRGRTGADPLVVFGIRIGMKTMYTPMLILSLLTIGRMIVALRPRIRIHELPISARWRKVAAVGLVAMALPMSPVLYAFGERLLQDQSQPEIYWRSSPPGVDLLAYVMPNPNHPLWGAPFHETILRWSGRPDGFEEFTAALPLVAIGLIAYAWRRTQWRPVPGLWIALGAYILLSLGPFIHIAGYNTHIPGPWALLRYVPVLGLARSPARIAVLALLCFAMMFAVALKHVTDSAPEKRRMMLAVTGLLLLFELLPAPRTLYSAEIPSLYRTIAADPDELARVLELPFGVRDGASSLGNFSALSQYYQTLHGKKLIGGYLSRVSTERKNAYRRLPMLRALMTLSEGEPIATDVEEAALAGSDNFLFRSHVKYIVVDREHTSPALLAFTQRALGLKKIAEEGPRDLYVPREPDMSKVPPPN
jgi:hypothetical protein